jgi:glutamyl-tRNA synthetase/glutamyl-Q tRNA(Asp) synthetase
MRGIISRFAPAPTGFLHLGHVVNAVTVWRETRARSGRVLLRIEDHDRQRSRRQFEDAILEDLAWLGFEADEPLVRQSERGAIYEEALERLRRQGLIYACDCSRSAIVAARGSAGPKGPAPHSEAGTAVHSETSRPGPFGPGETSVARRPGPFGPGEDAELWYPGTCRDRGLEDAPGRGLRVRLEPSVERFVDLRLGAQEQQPSEQCGDLLARDRDGNWTYQFAATVDDYVQGVNLVIRGVDLLASTGRQIQLARLLGRAEPPAFLHHPLIMKSPTSAGGFGGQAQKLSKSDGDTGIRDLRAAGWKPARVIEKALALAESAR